VNSFPPTGSRVLVIVAHADDPTLFCGGTIKAMSEQDCRITILRVTDDRFDSVDLDADATIRRNRSEFEQAAGLLGVSDLVDLDYHTDTLGDASELGLRERFIYHVRRIRPYAVISYDPYGAYGEDNQDHIRVAAAVDEMYWTAQFDKHHPEHFDEGLEPHGVFERWYFARRLTEVTTPVDISTTIEAKVEAVVAHETMMRNMVHQLRLQARTAGLTVPDLETAWESGDLRPIIDRVVRAGAASTGMRHGLGFAEEFRVVRFGGLGPLFGIGA